MTKRKTFSKEFKLEAVRLLEQADRSPNEIATDLGIRRNQLYKWQTQLKANGNDAFRGAGCLASITLSGLTTIILAG